jgi:hypothetical protein
MFRRTSEQALVLIWRSLSSWAILAMTLIRSLPPAERSFALMLQTSLTRQDILQALANEWSDREQRAENNAAAPASSMAFHATAYLSSLSSSCPICTEPHALVSCMFLSGTKGYAK